LLFGIWNLDLWVVGDRVEGVGDAKFQVRGDESDDATATSDDDDDDATTQIPKEKRTKSKSKQTTISIDV